MDTIKRVQDLMQERDMNLCVLAKKCGISYSTIQTTARRGGQLSVETIEKICQGLGITLNDFFDSSLLYSQVQLLPTFDSFLGRFPCLCRRDGQIQGGAQL